MPVGSRGHSGWAVPVVKHCFITKRWKNHLEQNDTNCKSQLGLRKHHSCCWFLFFWFYFDFLEHPVEKIPFSTIRLASLPEITLITLQEISAGCHGEWMSMGNRVRLTKNPWSRYPHGWFYIWKWINMAHVQMIKKIVWHGGFVK